MKSRNFLALLILEKLLLPRQRLIRHWLKRSFRGSQILQVTTLLIRSTTCKKDCRTSHARTALQLFAEMLVITVMASQLTTRSCATRIQFGSRKDMAIEEPLPKRATVPGMALLRPGQASTGNGHPKVVTSLRGRPRNDRISSDIDTSFSSTAPASTSFAGRPPPPAKNAPPRQVRASMRRDQSAFEMLGEWPEEVQESMKRRRGEEGVNGCEDNPVKRQRALPKCSKCGSFEHTSRTCNC
jgi:hypothetical protein